MPATRRRIIVVLAALVAAGAGPAAQPRGAVVWVWSGGVTSRSAVVKARVGRGGMPVQARVTRAGARGQGRDLSLETVSDADGIAVFGLPGLEPAAAYSYRVQPPGGVPMEGEFRTFGEGPWSFRLAFSACAETGSASPVFDAIREARPDLFIHTGDIHYEDITRNEPDRFRRAFDAVMASPTQSRLYRSVPTAYTWDDHDFGGNGSDASSAAGPAALAVYRQFVPHYPLEAGGRMGIHQAFTIGRVRVIMTDSRSQRTSIRIAPQRRSMLGPSQLTWLKDQLSRAADAPLVIWVNTVPWIASPGSGSDNWGSYTVERAELATHIERLGLTGRLLMLSGDAHMVAIDDGTHSNYATGYGRGQRGFVVMHAAPLDRRTSEKGGPYSLGISRERGQFGLVEVTDAGQTLRVELSGRDRAGAPIPGMRLALACADSACDVTPSAR
jgi:phosphodiesterase/alkaline phosphatase D-like protein